MHDERKQVKLTMSCERYDELQERASRMSISVPAMCCYILGEKLAQMRLAEGAGLDALKNLAENFAKADTIK